MNSFFLSMVNKIQPLYTTFELDPVGNSKKVKMTVYAYYLRCLHFNVFSLSPLSRVNFLKDKNIAETPSML